MTTEQQSQLETEKNTAMKAVDSIRRFVVQLTDAADELQNDINAVDNYADLYNAYHAAMAVFLDMRKRGQIGTDWTERRADELDSSLVWAD